MVYIFNNIFSSSDQVSTNDLAVAQYPSGAGVFTPTTEYNNTVIGPGSGHYAAGQGCIYASAVFENNAVGGCSRFVDAESGATPFDYNAYADSGTSTNCFGSPANSCNFATWQGGGKDAHSVFNGGSAVGSNVSGVGTNLTSLCTGALTPLCQDINGNARPSVGAWDAGAG